MAGSAIVGQPPANQHDKEIIEGFWRFINHQYGPHDGPPNPTKIPKKPNPDAPRGVNGDVIGKDIAIFTIVFILILALSGSRLWVRAFNKKLKWGPDDWAMIVATIVLLGVPSAWLASIRHAGIGKHIWNITYQQYQNYFMFLTINQEFFYLGVGLVQISICLFNRRLTGLSSRGWIIYNNVLLILLVLYCLTTILTQAIMCVPTWSFMDFAALGRRTTVTHCMDSDKLAKALGFAHAALDILLVPVPLILLWKVRMNRIQKIKTMALFSLGLLSMVSAIVRNTLIYRSAKRDSTFYIGPKTWLIVDILSALACANLPILHALLPTSWRKGLSRDEYQRSLYRDPEQGGSERGGQGLYYKDSKSSLTGSGNSEGGNGSLSKGYVGKDGMAVESRRAGLEGYGAEVDIATGEVAKS